MTSLPAEPSHRVVATETRTCKDHGPYEAKQWGLIDPPRMHSPPAPGMRWLFEPFWGNCPTCDAAWQRETDERDAEIRGGTTIREMAFRARMLEAGIPRQFAEATIWNWTHSMDKQRRVWEWARDYASQHELVVSTGRSAVLYGHTGTGKTHLAIGILRHILEKGGTGLYTTAADMLARIKATYARAATETEPAVMDALTSVDLLVLDECGRQQDTEHERSLMFRVLDRRSADLRPTIVGSNLSREPLRAFLGEALVDRLRQRGGMFLLFDWGSARSTRKPESASDGPA